MTKIASKLVRSHSITVTCTIHPKSEADNCVVMAIAYNGVTSTGNVNNYIRNYNCICMYTYVHVCAYVSIML